MTSVAKTGRPRQWPLREIINAIFYVMRGGIGWRLFATVPAIAIAAFITIGVFGVTMNPAMAARVMCAAHPDPMVNAIHSSVITPGLAVGTWAGGLGIDAGYGLTAPLWVGLALALIGLTSLAPARARRLA